MSNYYSGICLYFLIIIWGTLHPAAVSAQFVSNYNGLLGGSATEIVFMHEVKLVDEFIERFNDTSASLRTEYLAMFGQPLGFNHRAMLLSLFDLENDKIRKSETAKEFVRFFSNPPLPCYLSICDTNLYVKTNAIFLDRAHRSVNVPITLRVSGSETSGFYWMISSIGNFNCWSSDAALPLDDSGFDEYAETKYIPLNAANTYFSFLANVFTTNIEPKYYFTQELINSANGSYFLSIVNSGGLTFDYIESMKYWFCVPGRWMFSLSYFPRKTDNSGWLIDNVESLDTSASIPSRRIAVTRLSQLDSLVCDTAKLQQLAQSELIKLGQAATCLTQLYFPSKNLPGKMDSTGRKLKAITRAKKYQNCVKATGVDVNASVLKYLRSGKRTRLKFNGNISIDSIHVGDIEFNGEYFMTRAIFTEHFKRKGAKGEEVQRASKGRIAWLRFIERKGRLMSNIILII